MKKRSRDADGEALSTYLQSPFVRSVRYNEVTQRFNYASEQGGPVREAYGLLSYLRAVYYPTFVEGAAPTVKSRIKSGRPSSADEGIRVDNDLERLAHGGDRTDLHPFSDALLAHWQRKGHTVVAAQVPVRVDAQRMTRADVITRDERSGKLYVWEVKCGMPASLHNKQGVMQVIPGAVPCTKFNQWQLQCEYTRRALVQNAGLPIAGGRVIQVYAGRGKEAGTVLVKEHRTAPWVKQLK